MSTAVPGRNEPCPCGSGRKFKHCCLQDRDAQDSVRLRLRGAEARVVGALQEYIAEIGGETLIVHAWEDFWNYEDVPEGFATAPEFDTMFIPWLLFGFVPDANADERDPDWPNQPIGKAWLTTVDAEVSALDRTFVETACRSPMSVFAVEQVTPGRSLDLKDVLTGSRFHVLEQGASRTLRPADLVFARVKGHVEVITRLIAAGSTVDAQSRDGYTALMQAAQALDNPIESVTVLLKAGADKSIRDKYGKAAVNKIRTNIAPKLRVLLQ
jgi:SEC-C motif-containing protein/ankyrin repeat protein